MSRRAETTRVRSKRLACLALVLAMAASSCDSGVADESANGVPADSGPSGTAAASTIDSPPSSPPPLLTDGVISGPALDALFTDGSELDDVVLASYVSDLEALPIDQRNTVMADLSLRTELELASLSGLEEAIGGPAATEAALTGASAKVSAQNDAEIAAITAAAEAAGEPQGMRRSLPERAPSGATVGTVGLFFAVDALGWSAAAATETTNKMEPGAPKVGEGEGMKVNASVDKVETKAGMVGTQEGVDVELTSTAALQPCPGPDGSFTIEALVELKASKAGVGQNVKLELKVTGTVDDNAELAERNIEYRVKWSELGGGREFFDFAGSERNGVDNLTINSTGPVSDDFWRMAVLLGTSQSLRLANKLLDTAQAAWKSGRCVKLTVTPSAGPTGLDPSEVVAVLAEPRSKVDGQPTGGNVTATLTAGGASVDPNGSPVPADANSMYTAPAERDKSGSVAYESRSRRGVGKAALDFDTKRDSYTAAGGGGDVTISGTVDALDAPFSLDGGFIAGSGTFNYSGGDGGGTVTVTGGGNGASVMGDGPYTIADNGDGSKTLTQIISACVTVTGKCNTKTHVVILTPVA